MLIDDAELYHEVHEYVAALIPELADRIDRKPAYLKRQRYRRHEQAAGQVRQTCGFLQMSHDATGDHRSNDRSINPALAGADASNHLLRHLPQQDVRQEEAE